ncbi:MULTISPECIES: GntR family transcriptional regulator [unclassified Colwellia]|jgi:DNA-binding GntR family transcriptional regulator|uniref:GntR family transcriptional regulator n=1 Tax=unclassified Colwellia TaxID=196834 RepID=UPI0015F51D6D|nr:MULTISPECIES: GntR family transcriptional regulator [unclassified Colwellia]MBA6362299.1 GntR family transcriptional regulator [Colwellia sp. BRX8-8]MBA6250974.1 GntR family transcriptional regulator [Colwellia sp. MB3u-55]MBA6336170.1 GntR family transcriptional regulator [Colwellia sp. BRX8-7]MBA6350149.1 GntR family transcriptional regulator [Colwellia sp. BRX8-9]MBA6352462.1 GntR family transcriptional regulator [Colwellia sp. BRX9-1]
MALDNPTLQEPVTTADKVFYAILHAIVDGKIAAGSKISEPGLAKQYEISRSTLREALNRLEKCHLIERKANVGSRVVDCTIEGLLEIYVVREALEGMACREAAINMSDDEIAEMQDMLAQHANSQDLIDGVAYYQEEGDLDFHYKVILGSHNQQLINILCGQLYHLVRMYRIQFGMHSPRATRAFEEHSHIIQAICDRDGELAEILMRRHIAASRKNIEKKIALQNSATQ